MKPISTVRSGIAALAFVAGAIPAAAAFPERAITLIVPFAAGGPGDTVVRLIGDAYGQDAGPTDRRGECYWGWRHDRYHPWLRKQAQMDTPSWWVIWEHMVQRPRNIPT